ncbi:hypothetical protein ACIQ6V_32685 [Streptomyces sp. NPDC096198]|uniref:hypothetical protein n=1 Tax=Streptomyces sp. NPDC096198 TaxID=3366080 RepID=UPI00382B42CF
MNGIKILVHTLHQGEQNLAEEFTAFAKHYRAEHEIHFVATDLAAWSHEHAQRLVRAAADCSLDLTPLPDAVWDSFPATRPERMPEQARHLPGSGLLLLRDLCDLHLAATCNSLHWEMLAQAAQASRKAPMLTLVSHCHPQTLRQMRWTNIMIKNLSPQAVTSL